jgi:hypothetical protein
VQTEWGIEELAICTGKRRAQAGNSLSLGSQEYNKQDLNLEAMGMVKGKPNPLNLKSCTR